MPKTLLIFNCWGKSIMYKCYCTCLVSSIQAWCRFTCTPLSSLAKVCTSLFSNLEQVPGKSRLVKSSPSPVQVAWVQVRVKPRLSKSPVKSQVLVKQVPSVSRDNTESTYILSNKVHVKSEILTNLYGTWLLYWMDRYRQRAQFTCVCMNQERVLKPSSHKSNLSVNT